MTERRSLIDNAGEEREEETESDAKIDKQWDENVKRQSRALPFL